MQNPCWSPITFLVSQLSPAHLSPSFCSLFFIFYLSSCASIPSWWALSMSHPYIVSYLLNIMGYLISTLTHSFTKISKILFYLNLINLVFYKLNLNLNITDFLVDMEMTVWRECRFTVFLISKSSFHYPRKYSNCFLIDSRRNLL